MKHHQHPLHRRAVHQSRNYIRAERYLMQTLSEIDQKKLFREFGYNSTFQYALSLGLTEAQAYALITVSRKCEQVPELKMAVLTGELSVSKAKRIAAVVDTSTSHEWIAAAKELTCHEIEKKISATKPEVAHFARISPVAPGTVKLSATLSEGVEKNLHRLQHVLSQKWQRAAKLEDTLAFALAEALERHDPLEKAKRHAARVDAKNSSTTRPAHSSTEASSAAVIASAAKQSRGTKLPTTGLLRVFDPRNDTGGRIPLPGATQHFVRLRDNGRCQAVLPTGKICASQRFLEVNHREPVANGGNNSLTNLITLCSAHHRSMHPARRDGGFRSGDLS